MFQKPLEKRNKQGTCGVGKGKGKREKEKRYNFRKKMKRERGGKWYEEWNRLFVEK